MAKRSGRKSAGGRSKDADKSSEAKVPLAVTIIERVRAGIEWTVSTALFIMLPWVYYSKQLETLKSEMQELKESGKSNEERLSSFHKQLQTLQTAYKILSQYHSSPKRLAEVASPMSITPLVGTSAPSPPPLPFPTLIMAGPPPPPPPPPPGSVAPLVGPVFRRAEVDPAKPKMSRGLQPPPISEEAIRSIRLRKRSSDENNTPSPSPSVDSPTDLLAQLSKEMKGVKLRQSIGQRSPGGTPLRVVKSDSPGRFSANNTDQMIASALRKRFQGMYPVSPQRAPVI